jgi:hypothetical protein
MSKGKNGSRLTDSDIAIVPREPEFPVDGELQLTENSDSKSVFVFGKAPVPTKKGRTTVLSYPIDQLVPNTGEYFDVPATSDKVKAVSASIRTFAYRNDLAVILREVPGAVRVWRKAEKATRSEYGES